MSVVCLIFSHFVRKIPLNQYLQAIHGSWTDRASTRGAAEELEFP